MSFLPIYFYFIVASFLSSIYLFIWPQKTFKYLKLFPPFLFATIIVELIATYLAAIEKPNNWLYNFFTVFEFCFYLWVINLLIHNSIVKRIIKIAIPVYTLIAAVNIIFIQKIQVFHTMTYALGCLIITAGCVYYFFELFKQPKSVKLITDPSFWICSGLLFFYCCGFPLYGLINFLSGISELIVNNYSNIIAILNIFLYTLFTIAFLCRVKIRKYT